jgi:hypothetical protein
LREKTYHFWAKKVFGMLLEVSVPELEPERGRVPKQLQPYAFRVGQSGNPGGRWAASWRLAILKVVRDGKPYWEMLDRLARGRLVTLRDSSGRRVGTIKPTAPIILAAIRELLDRAYGRPVQQVLMAEMGQLSDSAQESARAEMLSDLSPEDRAALQTIARKLATRAKPVITLENQESGTDNSDYVQSGTSAERPESPRIDDQEGGSYPDTASSPIVEPRAGPGHQTGSEPEDPDRRGPTLPRAPDADSGTPATPTSPNPTPSDP